MLPVLNSVGSRGPVIRGRATALIAAVSLILVAFGCSSDHSSPTAPADAGPAAAVEDPGASSVFVAFSPRALDAGKITSNRGDWLRTSKVARPNRKTRLRLKDDDLRVDFTVPRGAVEKPVRITMATQVRPLSELVVEMRPEGTEFDPSADLKLRIDADLVDFDLSDLVALVASGEDGDVAYVRIISVETHGDGDDEDDGESAGFDSVTIRLEVPHFSRYGLRNGNGLDCWDGGWWEGCDFPPCPPPPPDYCD